MAKKGDSLNIEFPFYKYLLQFYEDEKKQIYSYYKPLTKKILAFNDYRNARAFLRPPQFEAFEMYVLLKEFTDNSPMWKIFTDWFNKNNKFSNRKDTGVDGGLFAEISHENPDDIKKYTKIYEQLKAFNLNYSNYIFALTMGLGKTVLMATCIFYDFILANKFPKDDRFCHNALIFAPDKTVLQSLLEVKTMDKSKVIPPEYVNWLESNIHFHFLDDSGISLNTIDNSKFNIIISNTQKIILRKIHKEALPVQELFKDYSSYYKVLQTNNDYSDLYGFDIDNEDTLLTNQRFSKLIRLEQLGVYVDEAHHVFGNKLKSDLIEKEKSTSLRFTINQLAAQLEKAGTKMVACYNYTGTPYIGKVLLPEVVYAYGLRNAIDNKYLKRAEVKAFSNIIDKKLLFVRQSIGEFWSRYGNKRMEGMLPKIALFSSTIEELQSELKPAVERVLEELGIPLNRILVNVGDDSITSNDDIREFKNLDSLESEKQFILLVNKGKEGWNCRSLFAVALHREPKSKIFVLQATMRCLRQITDHQQTALIFLSEENKAILNSELEENFRLKIEDLNREEDNSTQTEVRLVPPPVKVRLKRTRNLHELIERKDLNTLTFNLEPEDIEHYKIIESSSSVFDLNGKNTRKRDISDININRAYSFITLIAEISRYLNISPLKIEEILENCAPEASNIIEIVNKYNQILYDIIIPNIFNHMYEIRHFSQNEEIEINLVKEPIGQDFYSVSAKKGLIASLDDKIYEPYLSKTFHLDKYCFDSNPEKDLFFNLLKDSKIDKIWFTGMLTHGQSDFYISYIDPESHTLRSYYPDFLLKNDDGSYTILEVKADFQVDDRVVQAKMEYAKQLASASGMKYFLVPASKVNTININTKNNHSMNSFFDL